MLFEHGGNLATTFNIGLVGLLHVQDLLLGFHDLFCVLLVHSLTPLVFCFSCLGNLIFGHTLALRDHVCMQVFAFTTM